MKIKLDDSRSRKGYVVMYELDGEEKWEVTLESARTGDTFTLVSNDQRRAENKFEQMKSWVLGRKHNVREIRREV